MKDGLLYFTACPGATDTSQQQQPAPYFASVHIPPVMRDSE
jgi:hypothetical protein